ncbi:CD109 antigen-like isoform X3 [Biomphalaria glabrata]|uniref:CD109 antigen-like isoform X3 n=1 Tax=Biomphalaria glabrata TaxID=6526 RepID=A0A9W3B0T5_BIOGL|nr:CD109 antigen-like isoform X3 [Biomphalaria glabrata]
MNQIWLAAAFLAAAIVHFPAQCQLVPIQDESTTPLPLKNATYWMTVSSTVRQGQPLEFRGQILVGSDPVSVTVTLLNGEGTKTLKTSPAITLSPGAVQSFKVDVPENIMDLSGEEYLYQIKVQMVGKGKTVNFKEEVLLTYESKSFFTFIQTDKAMYKPGQTVKFRVLSMTPDLKVIRDNSNDIIIEDSNKNKIRQWQGVKDPNGRGVMELSLKIAKQVVFGDWTITVKTKGTETLKTFTVQEYKLPKYEVMITTPPFGIISDPVLPITVKAIYTFGQPVSKGTVDVVITLVYSLKPEIKISGLLNKDGEFTLQVSSKQLLGLVSNGQTDLNYQSFKINANVTETDTGRNEGSSVTIIYYKTPLQLTFLGISPNNFKPGLGYTAYLEVKKKDDTLFTLAEASQIRLLINVTYTVQLNKEEMAQREKELNISKSNIDNTSGTDEKQLLIRPGFIPYYDKTKTLILTINDPIRTVPDNGLIPINLDIPMEAESVSIEVNGLEPFAAEKAYKSVSKMKSPTGTYLQLKVPTETPKVGSTIKVTAVATEVITKLNFQVYSKGQLLLSEIINNPQSNTKSVEYSFTISQAMAPTLTIIAFFMKAENSEFVVDSLSIGVDGLFQKPITVEFSKTQVKPGEKVDVTIKAESDSIVYLLGVDKSVQLLKSGNDITQAMVQEELMGYGTSGDYGMWRFMFFCGWPSYFGGTDAKSILSSAGVHIITDGLVYKSAFDNYFRGHFYAAPQAMAVQTSAYVGAIQVADVVRKYFPETWLWNSDVADSNGQVTLSVTAPDTITTWVVTAFSAHPVYGLSIVKESANLTTFRDLFVSLDLPISIIRNENFCFVATVFCYNKEEIPVLLTLDKSDNFSNIHVKVENGQVILSKESLHYSHFLGYLAERDISSVKFCFMPTALGDIPLRVSALTNIPGLSDAMEQIITVKPEGAARSTSNSYLIDMATGRWEMNVTVKFPAATVTGSETIIFNTAGNLLGPMFDNLDDLLKKPYGCGEQNMLNFAPNIFLLEFLFSTNKNRSVAMEKAKDNMLIGYQKEITYEHSNTGGFSAFGHHEGSKDSASSWLTSFVVKCFAIAFQLDAAQGNVITIEKEIIQRSVRFMISQQNLNGSFTEKGKVFHKEMQGGSAEGEALTAYTVIALYEAQKVFASGDSIVANISQSIKLGVDFLVRRLPFLTDPYDICIVTYTLHLVNDNNKETAFNKMQSIAITGDGLRYWKRATPAESNIAKYEWTASADSISIEMTSYALLVYAFREIANTEGLPIVRWITNHRGPNGGFISTQDTVIGLQALARVAAKIYSNEDIPITLAVSYESKGQLVKEIIKINKSNEMLLQSVDINYKDEQPNFVNIVATTDSGKTGPSTVIAEIVLGYNILAETSAKFYDMSHTLDKLSAGFVLTILIKTTKDSSSMCILEVDIPPGFTPDSDALKLNKAISLSEILGDVLAIYFNTDMITTKETPVKIFMVSTGGVLTKSQPRMYRVYDYYTPDRELSKNYLLEDTDFCTAAPDVGGCQYRQK